MPQKIEKPNKANNASQGLCKGNKPMRSIPNPNDFIELSDFITIFISFKSLKLFTFLKEDGFFSN